MEIFCNDVILDDFVASNYGLTVCSFQYDGQSEDEVFAVNTTEEFIGENPKVTYVGQKYSFKIEGTISLMKDVCKDPNAKLTEYECRAILRKTTGKRGYKWMKVITQDIGEDLWYRARVTNASLKRISGNVVGIILTISTDSYMCYSTEFSNKYSLNANEEFKLFINSDDLVNYVYPKAIITPKSDGLLRITALKDTTYLYPDGYVTELKDVLDGRPITLDGQYKLIDGTNFNNFNMHWMRFVPDLNVFVPNMDCDIQFVYRLPRKVGFICQ